MRPETLSDANGAATSALLNVAEVVGQRRGCARPGFAFATRLAEPRGVGGWAVVYLRTFAPSKPSSEFSLDDLLELLPAASRAAAATEARVLNDALRESFSRGEVPAVTYYRRLARMSQEQLAARSGVRQSYVSRIERGRASLTLKMAKRLAPHLGVDFRQLIED